MDLSNAGISSVNVLNATNLFSHPVSYRIPYFQRPYCWTKQDQWEPLWRDIIKTADRYRAHGTRTRAHFMGAMVTQQQGNKPGVVQMNLVIDGQQRLATLQVAIRASADAVASRGLQEVSNRLTKLTRNDEDYLDNDQENIVKVRQTDPGDRTTFAGVMQGNADDGTSGSDIGKCYRYFREQIDNWLAEEPQENGWRVEALEAVLSQSLAIATIDLREDAEPYTIFATLNDRGVRLGPGDIIKNMLMHKADVGNSSEKAERVWGTFGQSWWRQPTGENNLERTHIDRYLDHWLTIQTGAANRKLDRLPADFNDYLEDHEGDIWTIVEDITKGAKIYRAIHEQKLSGAEQFLTRMYALKIGAPMATVLWLYKNPIPQDSRDVMIQAIESYIIRRTLAGMTTNALREVFAAIASELPRGWSPKLGQDLIEILARETPSNQKWPTDSEIREFLRTSPMKGINKGKVSILAAMEEHIRSPMAEPVAKITNLTIEHIMPKEWLANWPLSNGTDSEQENAKVIRDRAVQFIGNLTLVTKSLNSSVKNKPWVEKQVTLKEHSTLALNQTLLSAPPTEWDETAIRKRCEDLAEIASQIWLSPAKFREIAHEQLA